MGRFINKYNYESAKKFVEDCGCEFLSDDYYGMGEVHSFRCECGEVFETKFAKFQNRGKRQCNKCGRAKANDLTRLKYDEVSKTIKEYGCELISDKYKSYKDRLNIKCVCGNIFTRNFADFRNGTHRCDECAKRISDEAKMKYTYEYVQNLLYENRTVLLTEKYGTYIGYKDKILCRCECGSEYETTFEMVRLYDKFRCTSCNVKDKKGSIGEEVIKDYYIKNNIEFKQQYSFPDCKYKYPLKFDFAVFDSNNELSYVCEFDGIQHFKPYDYFGGEHTFKDVKIRDKIKNDYCKNNNILLVRIPYYKMDNIEQILEKIKI